MGKSREQLNGSSVSPSFGTGALHYYHHSLDYLVVTIFLRQVDWPSSLIQIPRPKLLISPFSSTPPPLIVFPPTQSDSRTFILCPGVHVRALFVLLLSLLILPNPYLWI